MANTIKIKNSGTTSNVPFSLEHGELAINYADGLLFYKNSSNVISQFSSGGEASVTISDTAPSSPSAGDLWYESDTGDFFVYYDSYWVELGADPASSSFLSDLDGDTLIQVEESNDEDKIRFDTAGSERMVIDASGKVGIGTTSPQTPLHISQTGADALRIQKSNNDQQGSYISMWDDDQRLGYIGYAGNDDLYLENEASAGKTFLSTAGTVRVTVASSGNVGIGTTSPGSLLDVRGGVQTHRILPFTDGTYDLGANVLRWDDVYATNGTIQTSDERDKASVADIDLGLGFINDLRPVIYTWDDRSGNVGARTHMGFIAQEVATVLGDESSNRAVWIHASAEQTTDPETGEVDEGRDIQGLRYNELMAPMVKSIQELSATVQTLTDRIETLEAG